jgi:hypothetical protein
LNEIYRIGTSIETDGRLIVTGGRAIERIARDVLSWVKKISWN